MQGFRPGTSPPPVSTPMRVIKAASRKEGRSICSEVSATLAVRFPRVGRQRALAHNARMTWYWPSQAGSAVCWYEPGSLGQLSCDAVDVERASGTVHHVVAGGSLDAGR